MQAHHIVRYPECKDALDGADLCGVSRVACRIKHRGLGSLSQPNELLAITILLPLPKVIGYVVSVMPEVEGTVQLFFR